MSESTRCPGERNFSALAFPIGSLRSFISPSKVERLIFLRLNRLLIPEVQALHDPVEANKSAAAQRIKNVAQLDGVVADTAVPLTI